MKPRFMVIETTSMDDSKRYRVVDLVQGGPASKHGVYNARAEADAVCAILNAEYPKDFEGVTASASR